MGMMEVKLEQGLNQENGVKQEAIRAIANVYFGSSFYDCFTNFRIISPQEIVVTRSNGNVERIYNATVVVRYKDSEEK